MMDLDEQLQAAGERWRAAERAPVVDFRRATLDPVPTSRTPRRSRALVLISLAATVAVVIGAISLLGDDGSSRRRVVVRQPTVPTVPSTLNLDPRIKQVGALAFDSGGGAWVTGYATANGAATLEHIETRTGKVLGTVELPDNSPFQIVVGYGAVWVASQQNEESAHVIKVDPSTMKIIAVIPTAGDTAVAVTPDAVWFNVNTGVLQRRDPVTNEVVATIPIPGGPYSAHGITASPEGIFLANSYDGTVWRVDPATNTLEKVTDIGDSAGQILELGGWLWINAGSFVVQIDPVTGVFQRTVARSVQNLVSDGSSLWGASGRDVVRIDPRTGAVTTVTLPVDVVFAIALGVDPSTNAVWAASGPRTGETGPQRLLRLAP